MPLAIEQLIADFGGVAPGHPAGRTFSGRAGVARAIYKWRERGSLPLAQAERLRVLAQRLGRGLS